MKVIIEGGQWDPREFRPEVPQGLAEAVMRALAPGPDKRFATADAFRRALEQAADAAGLRHGTDEVAAFVDGLAGDSLRANEAAVTAAVERAKTQGYDDADLADTEEPRAPARSPTDTMPRAWTGSRPMVATRLPLPRSTWRWAMAVFLLAVAVGAGGAWLLSRQPALQGPAHRVGWPPTIDAAVLAVDVEPLRQHLERATGRPVEFIYSQSYGQLADQLLDGGVAFASLPPALLVRTERRDPRVQALALKLIGGSSGTDGVLLSVEGSGVATLLDLKGKRVCVPDDQSTTGLLLPRYAARRAGVDWEKEVTVVHSGNHLQVLRDLAARKCEAGGTYQGAFVNAVTQGVDVSMLRQIAITGRSPQDTLVAGPAASKKDIEAFKAALFTFAPQAGRPGESLGTIERITGFAPVKPEDFTALREMMDAEGAPGPP